MSRINQHPVLEVSTAHVAREDLLKLDQLSSHPDRFPAINAGFLARTAAGYLFWIGDECLHDEHARLLLAAGFSPALTGILAYVHRHVGHFCYLMLDHDVECIEELPTFDH